MYLATEVLGILGVSLEAHGKVSVYNTEEEPWSILCEVPASHWMGHSSLRSSGLACLPGTIPISKHTKAQEGRGTDRRGKCSPLERGHVVFECLHEGEDPVVTENHALRQAEMELLHLHQSGHECLSSGQQHIKQIQELFLRFI